jgi:hypothetical protein
MIQEVTTETSATIDQNAIPTENGALRELHTLNRSEIKIQR